MIVEGQMKAKLVKRKDVKKNRRPSTGRNKMKQNEWKEEESRKGNVEDKQIKRRKMRENRAIIKNKHETDSG